MTLCTYCKNHYYEHTEGDLIHCNKQKDSLILNLKLDIAMMGNKSHINELSENE